MTRQVRFMIGKEFFWSLNEAMKYKRKHGGEIRQVYSTVIEKHTSGTTRHRKQSESSKYDPSAPLPDSIQSLLT